MSQQPTQLAHAPFARLREARYEVALLPWGATEPHNLHLPYGTDLIETERIAAEAVRKASERGARVIVLPIVPFGVNTGQLDLPLTINMNPSTQLALLDDVAESLERQGVPKLAILNGHGGNDFRQLIRELRPRRDLFLCTLNWYTAVEKRKFFDAGGDHADEMETSLMLHLAPELVLPLSEAGDGKTLSPRIQAFREGWAWMPRPWSTVSADTGSGDPRKATAEKGRRYFEAVTEAVAGFLVELSAADPGDMYV
ncbi:MAG: creatininase family protein [Bacteroidota bacterium]